MDAVSGSRLPGTKAKTGWILRQLIAQEVPKALVLGAYRSGKSTFFRHISEAQPHSSEGIEYRYWDLRSSVATTPRDFWNELSAVLAGVSDLGANPSFEDLTSCVELASDSPRVVLVLDQWDDAHDLIDVAVSELPRLLAFVVQQEQSRADTKLGVLAISRFPSMTLLRSYAHRTGGGFLRYSGYFERIATRCHFPFLSRSDTVKVLTMQGCSQHDAGLISIDCGGWLGLLELAIEAYRGERGSWNHPARAAVQRTLPLLLGKCLLPEQRALLLLREGEDGEAWKYIVRDLIQSRVDPELAYGLPKRFDQAEGLTRLPPILEAFQQPVRLIIDSENWRTQYDIDAQSRPELYPYGVDSFTQEHFPRIVRELAEEYRVPATNVFIAGRNPTRIRNIFGTLDDGWRASTSSVRVKKGDDDVLACLEAALAQGEDPRTHIVMATADTSHARHLARANTRHVTYYLLFGQPRSFPKGLPEDWTIRTNLFPRFHLEQPPESDSKGNPNGIV